MLMTLRKIAVALALVPVAGAFVACNSSSYSEEDIILPSSTAVKAFSLAEDDSVVANLDSVFFSIDLVAARIFNADSLPFGTEVTKLTPVITMLETASKVELVVKRSDGVDTTYNYTANSSEAIDFTNPVALRVTALDGRSERSYTISVNVHKSVPDSLSWTEAARTTLPTSYSAPKAQRTVRNGDDFYCLTTDGTSYCLATRKGNLAGKNGAVIRPESWNKESLSLAFTPRVETLTSAPSGLYILAQDGTLWESADFGSSWTSTGLKWHSIYGVHNGTVLGSLQDRGQWKSQGYPSKTYYNLPADMPVSGTSVPVSFTFPMSDRPQTLMTGGRLADGSLTGATWGFDGSQWAKVSKRDLPVAVEGVAVASYVTFVNTTGWRFKEYPSLLAFGGRKADGSLNRKVYVSVDYGYIWKEADVCLQLPAHLGDFADAQAYVMETEFDGDLALQRIVSAEVSWKCPYIYLFGGVDPAGNLHNTMWRGVINRLQFKPVE